MTTQTVPGGTVGFGYHADRQTSMTDPTGTTSWVYDATSHVTSVTSPQGAISYTYNNPETGSRWYPSRERRTTRSTIHLPQADELTSYGSRSYTYDTNGNLTAVGSSTYTWDYANRMTGATVGGTSSTYAYAGDEVRASKTVGGTTTSYLWDRQSGLPLLVGDGTNWYLQADNVIAEVDNANAAKYHLNDALGSVRGLADGAGSLAGSADYDVFGPVRANSGTSSLFASPVSSSMARRAPRIWVRAT